MSSARPGAACAGLVQSQPLACAGMQDVGILSKVPGWTPTLPGLAISARPSGRPKGKNRTAARK